MSANAMNRKKAIVLRARLGFLLVCLFALAIAVRLCYVQMVDGPKWKAELLKKNVEERVLKPTRGNIYSDNGSLLATSLPFYRVAFDPTAPHDSVFKPGIDSLAWLLSRQFGDQSAAEYRHRILDARHSGKEFIYLNRAFVDYQVKKKMTSWPIFRKGKIKGGVIFEKSERRYMPFRHLAFRTVGFLNEDNGGAGLEFTYNPILAGSPGKGIFRKIAGGHWKPVVEISRPRRGLDIQTTIDINIQDVAEASLEQALRTHRANFGCVVVMKVETGEIKAMANLGLMKDGQYGEKYNYAVAMRTDPGSTMKLASFMALVEEGCVKPEDKVETGNGVLDIMGLKMVDHKEGGYGTITVEEAFAKSSNVATSKLTMACFGKRPQKYVSYLHKFGLDIPLDFQLRGGAEPLIKTPSDPSWSGVTLPWMSVGYEVLMSPLQVLTFYNAVANNGTMVQPLLVKEIRDGDDVVERFQSKTLAEDIASEKTLETVRDMLVSVVEKGTATNIRNTEFRIAGKTGTAQKIINGRYTEKYYTSFCGFFPAEKPKYSCIVVIDEPKGWQQYGADVAAPVFKEVAEKVNSLEIDMHKQLTHDEQHAIATDMPRVGSGYMPDLHDLCNRFGVHNYNNDSVDEWVRARPVNQAVEWKPVVARQGRLPDVRGMVLRDALYLIENKGYHVSHFGEGRVVSQSPAPGAAMMKGGTVSLLLK